MSGTENPFQSNTTPENDSAGEAGGSRSVVRNTLSTGSQTTVINATEAVSNDNDPPTLTLRLTNTNDPNETETGEKSKPKKLARKQVSWTQVVQKDRVKQLSAFSVLTEQAICQHLPQMHNNGEFILRF